MAATSQAALQQDVVQLQAETATLQRQLESTLADFDRIQAEARRVELDVVEEVSHSSAHHQGVARGGRQCLGKSSAALHVLQCCMSVLLKMPNS